MRLWKQCERQLRVPRTEIPTRTPEIVWSFTAEEDAVVTLSDDNEDIDLFVLETINGTCDTTEEDTCVASGIDSVIFEAEAGKTYTVITDMWTPEASRTALTVECCVPNCDGKTCGDDGCGGSCGECGEGEECTEAGQCEVPCVPNCEGKECGGDGCEGSCGSCDEGDTCSEDGICLSPPNSCEAPEVLDSSAFPIVVTGDTSSETNDFSYGSGNAPE